MLLIYFNLNEFNNNTHKQTTETQLHVRSCLYTLYFVDANNEQDQEQKSSSFLPFF